MKSNPFAENSTVHFKLAHGTKYFRELVMSYGSFAVSFLHDIGHDQFQWSDL